MSPGVEHDVRGDPAKGDRSSRRAEPRQRGQLVALPGEPARAGSLSASWAVSRRSRPVDSRRGHVVGRRARGVRAAGCIGCKRRRLPSVRSGHSTLCRPRAASTTNEHDRSRAGVAGPRIGRRLPARRAGLGPSPWNPAVSASDTPGGGRGSVFTHKVPLLTADAPRGGRRLARTREGPRRAGETSVGNWHGPRRWSS
jgi:hypothetical protein